MPSAHRREVLGAPVAGALRRRVTGTPAPARAIVLAAVTVLLVAAYVATGADWLVIWSLFTLTGAALYTIAAWLDE